MKENSFTSQNATCCEDQGKILSEAGLDFLLGNPGELLNFMNVSGYDPDSMRESLATPQMELAIFAYFAENEPALLAMCANSGISPSMFMSHIKKQGTVF